MANPEEFASVESPAVPDFYTWTFPGAPVRIHLYLNAVERLNHEVRRAFESVPSHSVEIGGLLLGTADFQSSPIVEVKDFEPFLSEYRPDHKFILSESDRRKLEQTLETRRTSNGENLAVVGFYRSQIGGNLAMRDNDLSLAQACFFDPASVFLLIKPSPDGSSTAGFFFWDNRHMDTEFSFLEFPFDARLLTGARVKPSPLSSRGPIEDEEQDVRSPATGQEPAAVPAIFENTLEKTERHTRPFRWLIYFLLAAAITAAGVLSYPVYLDWMASRSPLRTPAVSDAPALALQVERHGNDLRVIWNRNSTLIQHASDAVLSIRDGDAQLQDLKLDLDQLHNGSVLYTPANTTVQFRLQVTGSDGRQLSETVLALTAAAPVNPNPAATPQNRRPPLPRPAATGFSAPPEPTSAAVTARSQEFGEPVRVVTVDPLPQAGNASSTPDTDAQPPADPYVAPRPVRQPKPVVPANMRAAVTSEVEVQIKVEIDSAGRVVKAEPAASTGPVNSSLVSAARDAALHWRFTPAMRGNQPVSSTLILKFQYQPARDAN